MNSTKNKILISSRNLLNKQGLSGVSLRTIAEYLKISPGNLTYHYKKRSDIIEALYFELVTKMDEAIAQISVSENLLKGMYDMTKVMMEQFYEYRFLFLDFIQIMRENEPIKVHYTGLLKLREQQFLSLFQMLIEGNLMRKEEFADEHLFLLKRMTITGDFWLASAELSQEKIDKNQIVRFLEINCLAIYPYLTDKGKQEYMKITDSCSL